MGCSPCVDSGIFMCAGTTPRHAVGRVGGLRTRQMMSKEKCTQRKECHLYIRRRELWDIYYHENMHLLFPVLRIGSGFDF